MNKKIIKLADKISFKLLSTNKHPDYDWLIETLSLNKNKLNRGDGYIGGVCKGLGEYTKIPAILWRLGFLFIIPASLCIYLLLWVFLKKNY